MRSIAVGGVGFKREEVGGSFVKQGVTEIGGGILLGSSFKISGATKWEKDYGIR